MATLQLSLSLSLSLSFPCFFLTSCLSHSVPCCSLHQSPMEKMSAIYALCMPNRIKHLSQAVPKSSVRLQLRIHCIVPTVSSCWDHTHSSSVSEWSKVQKQKLFRKMIALQKTHLNWEYKQFIKHKIFSISWSSKEIKMSKQVLSQGYTHTVVVTLHPSPKPPPLSKFLHFLSLVTGPCTEEWQQKKQFMLTNINTLHNPQPSYNTCKHTAKTRTRDFSEIQRKKRNQLCTLQSGNKLRQSVVNHAAKTYTESQSWSTAKRLTSKEHHQQAWGHFHSPHMWAHIQSCARNWASGYRRKKPPQTPNLQWSHFVCCQVALYVSWRITIIQKGTSVKWYSSCAKEWRTQHPSLLPPTRRTKLIQPGSRLVVR